MFKKALRGGIAYSFSFPLRGMYGEWHFWEKAMSPVLAICVQLVMLATLAWLIIDRNSRGRLFWREMVCEPDEITAETIEDEQ